MTAQGQSLPPAPQKPHGSPSGQLYSTPAEAAKAVLDDYHYWTGKLTDSSFELSVAVIAANWAVFASLDQLLANGWSKWSIGAVVFGLAVNLLGVKWLGELHRARIDYAESDLTRWEKEFGQTAGQSDPWPSTPKILRVARALRECRTWLPLLGGALFIIALFNAKPSAAQGNPSKDSGASAATAGQKPLPNQPLIQTPHGDQSKPTPAVLAPETPILQIPSEPLKTTPPPSVNKIPPGGPEQVPVNGVNGVASPPRK